MQCKLKCVCGKPHETSKPCLIEHVQTLSHLPSNIHYHITRYYRHIPVFERVFVCFVLFGGGDVFLFHCFAMIIIGFLESVENISSNKRERERERILNEFVKPRKKVILGKQ